MYVNLKVIVNPKNNVPFHFVKFYNDHVHLEVLLKKKTKFNSISLFKHNQNLKNLKKYKPSSESTSRCSR
jgi:hypothetical protein